MKIEIKKLKCERCGHKWVARREDILVCPKCRSPYWFRKRERKLKGD